MRVSSRPAAAYQGRFDPDLTLVQTPGKKGSVPRLLHRGPLARGGLTLVDLVLLIALFFLLRPLWRPAARRQEF